MGPQPFSGLDIASQRRVARILQQVGWRQNLRESMFDRKVAELRHTFSAGTPHKITDSVGSIQPPGKLSKRFGMAPDRCRRLSLRVENSVQPVLDHLLSNLPVPIQLDHINDYTEAPEIACRKNIQQRFVIVPTHADVNPPGVRVRVVPRAGEADRSHCQPSDTPGPGLHDYNIDICIAQLIALVVARQKPRQKASSGVRYLVLP